MAKKEPEQQSAKPARPTTARCDDRRIPSTTLCGEEQIRLARRYHSCFWVLIMLSVIGAISAAVYIVATSLGGECFNPTSQMCATLFRDIGFVVALVISGIIPAVFLVRKIECHRRCGEKLLYAKDECSSEQPDCKLEEIRKRHGMLTRVRKDESGEVVEEHAIDGMGRETFWRWSLLPLAGFLVISVLVTIAITNEWSSGTPHLTQLLRSILWADATGFLIGIALIITFYRVRPSKLQPAYEKCSGEFFEARVNACESGVAFIPQQPVNAYTNIAYAIGAVFVALYFAEGSPTGFVFMFAMIALCIGSALYHGLSTKWGGHLDVIGIYWVFGALMFLALGTLFGWDKEFTAMTMLVRGTAVRSLPASHSETNAQYGSQDSCSSRTHLCTRNTDLRPSSARS